MYWLILQNLLILVDPLNQTSLTVYSSGPAYDVQIYKLGVYKKTDEIKNGKSTWRNNQTGISIYYHGKIIECEKYF